MNQSEDSIPYTCKEYISIGTRAKAWAYAQSEQYHTIVESRGF